MFFAKLASFFPFYSARCSHKFAFFAGCDSRSAPLVKVVVVWYISPIENSPQTEIYQQAATSLKIHRSDQIKTRKALYRSSWYDMELGKEEGCYANLLQIYMHTLSYILQ